MIKNNSKNNRGVILSGVVVFSLISVSLIIALTSWFGVVVKSLREVVQKEQAFHIAEAGVEYYRWHLAHAPTDFQDGTGEDGPYVHDFEDKNGDVVGQFSLEITPPPVGSTVVTIESTGTVLENPDVSRTVRVQLAKPSFAKYAFVADDDMRFGEGTEVFGPIHSNGGIRFDGLAHNVVSSSKETYDDPDHSGNQEWGVHTHLSPIDPEPPTAFNNRPDVFEAGREIAVPAVDFDGVTNDISILKGLGQSDEGYYFSESGRSGYHIVLNTNDTFDLYKVESIAAPPSSSCNNSAGQNDWGTWSIGSQSFVDNYDLPENGVIFLEDDVWVSGQIDTARLTIVSGVLPDIPENRTNITINEDLLYTNYDGQDVISLIAQNNINVGLYSDDDLQIDAALIAQNGRVGRHYYRDGYTLWFWYVNGCEPYHERDTVTLYGMIGTNQRYGFAYTNGTGYENRNITYDANLLYSPPPSFPLTSDQYEPILWEEVVD
jgi:type II secretory pathway pseudopilin PulG